MEVSLELPTNGRTQDLAGETGFFSHSARQILKYAKALCIDREPFCYDKELLQGSQALFHSWIAGNLAMDCLKNKVIINGNGVLCIKQDVAFCGLAGVVSGGLLDKRGRTGEYAVNTEIGVATYETAIREFADAPFKNTEKNIDLSFTGNNFIPVFNHTLEFRRNHFRHKSIGAAIIIDAGATGHNGDGGEDSEDGQQLFFHLFPFLNVLRANFS